jgi:glucose dehydrogenase
MTVRFAPALAVVLFYASFLLDAQVRASVPSPRPCCAIPRRRLVELAAHRKRLGLQPLDQITRQNVGQLQLAWSWSMDDTGSQQATPLVTTA